VVDSFMRSCFKVAAVLKYWYLKFRTEFFLTSFLFLVTFGSIRPGSHFSFDDCVVNNE